MTSIRDATEPASNERPKGSIAGLRPLQEEDLEIWEMYKPHLEHKIIHQFNLPNTHGLKPVLVATQVVAGQNYFFKVELPSRKYTTARVYHVPWNNNTHGKEEQVAVHAKLLDDPHEDVGHF